MGREIFNFEEDIQVGQIFGQAMAQLQQQLQQVGQENQMQRGMLEQLAATVEHLRSAYVDSTGQPPPPGPDMGQSKPPSEGPGLPGGGGDNRRVYPETLPGPNS